MPEQAEWHSDSGDYTWHPEYRRRTSDYYMPCVVLWPNGLCRPGNVAHTYLDSVESAREKLAAGKVAWVRREDADQVMASGEIHG